MFHLIFIQPLQLKKLSPCNTPLSVVTSFRLSIRFCPKFEIPDVLNPRVIVMGNSVQQYQMQILS